MNSNCKSLHNKIKPHQDRETKAHKPQQKHQKIKANNKTEIKIQKVAIAVVGWLVRPTHGGRRVGIGACAIIGQYHKIMLLFTPIYYAHSFYNG